MIDVLPIVQEKVASYGYDAWLKRFDTFTGKEAICIRPVAATVIETYMDGSQELLYPYQIIVRRRSEEEAMQTCCDIAEQLESEAMPSRNGSYEWETGYIYAEPAELELEEQNFYAWACTMAARILTK